MEDFGPTKVLFLSPSGKMLGARISMLELCKRLDWENFEPVVAAPATDTLLEELDNKGITNYAVDLKTWRKAKSFPKHLFALKTLYSIIRRERIELIHSNESWVNPFGYLAGRFTRFDVSPGCTRGHLFLLYSGYSFRWG